MQITTDRRSPVAGLINESSVVARGFANRDHSTFDEHACVSDRHKPTPPSSRRYSSRRRIAKGMGNVSRARVVGPEFFPKFIASAALIKNYDAAGRAHAFYAGYLCIL